MAVIEYMQQLKDGKLIIPEWVQDRGHWMNSANTFIGWVDDDREYYIPDSVVNVSKTKLKNRLLAMHAENPFMKDDDLDNPVPMSDTEVTNMSNNWYDEFVSKNQS